MHAILHEASEDGGNATGSVGTPVYFTIFKGPYLSDNVRLVSLKESKACRYTISKRSCDIRKLPLNIGILQLECSAVEILQTARIPLKMKCHMIRTE